MARNGHNGRGETWLDEEKSPAHPASIAARLKVSPINIRKQGITEPGLRAIFREDSVPYGVAPKVVTLVVGTKPAIKHGSKPAW